MSKFSGLRSFFVPIVIVSVLFVGFAAYYLYWVPDRQRHLDDRGFRYLNTLSNQIRLTINTYDKMMDSAVDAGITKDILPQYLSNVIPELDVPDCSESAHPIGGDYDDPPKIAVEADEGTHFLYLAFKRDLKSGGAPVQYVVRTNLDKLISGFLGSANVNPFDVVLVARGDGRVIFQKSLSGIEVAEIKNLEDASGNVTGKDLKQIDVGALLPTSQLEEVRVAGARYRLYSQPLQVGFLPAHPQDNADGQNDCKTANPRTKSKTGNLKSKSSAGNSDTAGDDDNSQAKHSQDTSTDWVLCGMVRADRFRSESQLIPYAYILAMLAVILLAAASYPFLKLYLSSPGERLRARDVATMAVFTCLIAAVITFILADTYFWTRSFGGAAESEMRTLARAMNANFQREQLAASAELGVFDAKLNSLCAVRNINRELGKGHASNVSLLYGESDEKKCSPSEACQVDILNDKRLLRDDEVNGVLEKYPYPFFAFWTDSDGNQRIKWTTRRRVTPFIALDDTSAPYYPDVRRALKAPGNSPSIPKQGIGSQYSPTTGQNVTTFWRIIPLEEDKKKCDSDAGNRTTGSDGDNGEGIAAGLVTEPISVFNAVLPGGYQFAVLTPDGTVVFHSDTTRNLRENFLAETDLDPGLRSRIRMRAEGPVTANYLGRPHRMYVLPMAAGNQDGVWTVVIFRDLHLEEVMNLEILGLVSILFFLYAAVITLVVLAAHWMRKDKHARAWFWPDSRKSEFYRQAVLVNVACAIALCLLSIWRSHLAVLLCAAFVPAAAVLSNMVSLRRQPDLQPPDDAADQSNTSRWRSAYFTAAATLVLAIAVLPCLCFFKVAANFEQRLFIEHNMLQLVSDIDARDLAIRALYQDVHLGDFERLVLAGPDAQHATGLDQDHDPTPQAAPLFSYHELLDVTVSNGFDRYPEAPTLGDRFLTFISYPYNERASDDRHLAEGKSDETMWTTVRSAHGSVLELTKHEPSGSARSISSVWHPFQFPWLDWIWWLGTALLLLGIYGLVRVVFTRMFLLDLVAPPPTQADGAGRNPASLMADLPMDLLLIGPEFSRSIVGLLHRSDVQVHETEELLQFTSAATKSEVATQPSAATIDAMIHDGRPLVLRNFERLPDDPDEAATTHDALTRLLSALGNSVILVSSLDPVLIPSIEASDRWRSLLRSFVRIDLNATPRQRVGEDDADYQSRVSAESYFHWLFAGLPKLKKLVILQLAQEGVVNPNSSETVDDLMEQGMIERGDGLFVVKDSDFAHFLRHALPPHTVRMWEKEIAGKRPFSLQTSLMIVGVGVVAFLLYTQGDVFNTWVTYATGVASTVPKVLQFFDNLRSKTQASS